MTPDELRVKIDSKKDDDLERYIEFQERPVVSPSKTNQGRMTPEDYADYMDVTLSLAMNRCPVCQHSIIQTKVAGSEILNEFICGRNILHSWFRAVPLMTEREFLE